MKCNASINEIRDMTYGGDISDNPLVIKTIRKYGVNYRYNMQVDFSEATIIKLLSQKNISYTEFDSPENSISFSIDSEENNVYDVSCIRAARLFIYDNKPIAWFTAPFSNDIISTESRNVLCSDKYQILEKIYSDLIECSKFHFNEIAMFDSSDGGWRSLDDAEIAEIKKLSWDTLVLPQKMKNDLKKETSAFFSGELRDIYKTLGLPYKRGFIFIGMPGCGKTLTSKIIANEYKVPFLYVRNVTRLYEFERVYRDASACSPCVLVFEDLDSLVTEYSRTKFLNTLDGLTSAENILTIATTNHPEKIDPALLNRPSRFDRKWIFAPPDNSIKKEYLLKRLSQLYDKDEVLGNEAAIDCVCNDSKGYAYTMMQELVISATYIEKTSGASLSDALLQANISLKNQIAFGDAAKAEKKMATPAGNNELGAEESEFMGFLSSPPVCSPQN